MNNMELVKKIADTWKELPASQKQVSLYLCPVYFELSNKSLLHGCFTWFGVLREFFVLCGGLGGFFVYF